MERGQSVTSKDRRVTEAITESRYIVGTRRLAAVQAPVIAVVGIRSMEGKTRSLPQDVVDRARYVWAHGREQDANLALAMLLYCAQIGLLRTVQQNGKGHVRWPPIRNGQIVSDQREWRRPYLFQMTRQALNNKVHPRALNDLLPDTSATIDEALDLFRPGVLLRADDTALHDSVRWHDRALGYLQPPDDPSLGHLVGDEVRERVARRQCASWREALEATIERLVEEHDTDGLAELVRLIRIGHCVVHAAIRFHQLRALAEVGDLGDEWRTVLDLAEGLNRLLYEPIALFGHESWQFTTNGRTLRITVPETVGLGRDGIGRKRWLTPLMSAYSRGDQPESLRYLDELRQYLAFLGANPDALMMRPDPEEDAWEIADFVELEGQEPSPSRTDADLEQHELLKLLEDALTPRQWEAFYLVTWVGHTLDEAAQQLGVSASAVSQRVAAAKRALAEDARLGDWREYLGLEASP